MKLKLLLVGIIVTVLSGCVTNNVNTSTTNPAGYLFNDSLFTDSGIITEKDFSAFQNIVFKGNQTVVGWDRRRNPTKSIKLQTNGLNTSWRKNAFRAFIFKATFAKGNDITLRVNAEFKTKNKAEEQAIKYAKMIGQLPNFLRTKRLKTVTIHKGFYPWGGGKDDVLIHTEYYTGNLKKYTEEVLLHEAGHTTLDPRALGSVNSYKWNKAIKADNKFISKYARQFPKREDIAETILWWIVVRCKPDLKIKYPYDFQDIFDAIPNRLKYLDEQNYDTYPLVCK